MCGISGFCDFSLNYYDKKPFWETILVQMHETLKHRGPDQAMIDLQPHVGLSHARLSIRDLKKRYPAYDTYFPRENMFHCL